jgi:Reverse transcriptase (RNA-dependent DNA polymerase)
VTVINASVLETKSPGGVVQGSILGPVLFSLFINGLLEVIMFSQAHHYADDVQIYASGQLTDADRVIEKLNADMSNIWYWSQENGLSLNPQKSKAANLSLSTNFTKRMRGALL